MRSRAVLLACLALASTGCGSEQVRSDAAAQQHRGTATVLESPEHGPELCLGGQQDSYPPQCGGVPLPNWDWDAVDDEESANGTTWGAYTVVGTFDGTSLTLTEPPRQPEPSGGGAVADRFTSPCADPEPPTGAGPRGVDGVGPAAERARTLPGHAGLWLTGDLLNVASTGDPARHRSALREVWGGPLCLVQHERTLADLKAVQEELFDGAAAELGLTPTFGAVDEVGNVVELGVFAVDDAQQAALDARYGPGTVRVLPGLQPVPG
jgi:hypothetical protein